MCYLVSHSSPNCVAYIRYCTISTIPQSSQLRLRLPLLLLLHLVLQQPSQNLAGRRLGDLIDETNPTPQPLMIRDLSIHPLDNLVRIAVVGFLSMDDVRSRGLRSLGLCCRRR